MLYFLLAIIAIGVLLASEDGKKILAWLSGLAIIGAILYALFWIVVFGIAFFTSETGKDSFETIKALLVVIGFVAIGYALVIWIGQKWKERHQIVPNIRNQFIPRIKKDIKNFWFNNWTNATLKNRIAVICGFFLIAIIIFTWIVVPILVPDK